jgi:hypothetical protein
MERRTFKPQRRNFTLLINKCFFIITKISNQRIYYIYPYELMRGSNGQLTRCRPATLPWGFTSSVYLLRNRLLAGGARSVAISGFGCDFSAVWWVSVSSWKTVLTGGILRSVCRVWFVTYHGAFVICRRAFAWYRWITAKLEAAV